MENKGGFSALQIAILALMRILIGWHLLFEGIVKLMNPSWSALGFLSESKWILAGFSNWIISHKAILHIVDLMNIWGLILIGTALILGIFNRLAAFSGTVLLLLYYLCNPPLVGFEYSVPSDGSNLVVNKTLIEAITLFFTGLVQVHRIWGLEQLITLYKFRKHKN